MRNVYMWFVLVLVCVVGFHIRLFGAQRLPEGQFTETDAYLYVHQAQIVSSEGHLPVRDVRRWVPLGRDTGQSLNLYPIVLGYVHKGISFIFPSVSVSTVVAFAPVFCFCLGTLVLCVFLVLTEGWGIAVSVGVLLATLPGSIERSAVGFGDRDAWCLLIGVCAVTSYLCTLRLSDRRWRCGWTLASGFVILCGGLSWEGFGVFLGVVMCVEVWRFLSHKTEEGLSYYTLWMFSFLPLLYLASPAYRSGQGWSTHLFALVLVPPVAVLALRLLRYWLFERSSIRESLGPYRRQVSLLLLLLCFAVGIVYLVSIRETFSETTVAFGNSRLMQSIGELVAPHFGYWPYRYGSVFLTGSLGLFLMPMFRWGRVGRPLSVALGVFCLMVFFRQQMDAVCGAVLATGLFGSAVLAVFITFGHLAWKLSEKVEGSDPFPQGEMGYLRGDVLMSVAMLCWGVFWLALARDAKRYDFFIGVPLVYFTATLIQHVAGRICAVLRDPKWTTPALHAKLKRMFVNEAAVAAMLLIGVVVWGPIDGGHVFRAHAAATHLRHATPGTGPLADAYAWMKANLKDSDVVAAEWSYGTQLNVLGGVRTITGPDHYLPYWIELYHQYVERAKNEQEVIDFLFSHDATHLMMTTEKQLEGTMLRSGSLSSVFIPRYPESDFSSASVKVWELRYSAGIEKRPEYLSTGPEESAYDRQPYHHH